MPFEDVWRQELGVDVRHRVLFQSKRNNERPTIRSRKLCRIFATFQCQYDDGDDVSLSNSTHIQNPRLLTGCSLALTETNSFSATLWAFKRRLLLSILTLLNYLKIEIRRLFLWVAFSASSVRIAEHTQVTEHTQSLYLNDLIYWNWRYRRHISVLKLISNCS